MSTVFIPTVLRANVGGVKSLELAGATIGERRRRRSSSSIRRLGGQLLTDGR